MVQLGKNTPTSAGRGKPEDQHKSWAEQANRVGQYGNAGAACPAVSPAGLDVNPEIHRDLPEKMRPAGPGTRLGGKEGGS